jgi:hypothetical protein
MCLNQRGKDIKIWWPSAPALPTDSSDIQIPYKIRATPKLLPNNQTCQILRAFGSFYYGHCIGAVGQKPLGTERLRETIRSSPLDPSSTVLCAPA